jgi:PEGA domain-containing protein
MIRTRLSTLFLLGPALAALTGCGVQRTLQIDSDPPGALVYLNGDEVGRTPMRKNFLWYGTYDVELRKEGYQTLVKPTKVWAPWWQWPPVDFLAELVPLPLEDKHAVQYRLKPMGIRQIDPDEILKRAVSTRGRLRGSRYRQEPETKPSEKKPAPRRAPTTQPVR